MNAKAFLCVKPDPVVSSFWRPALGQREELKPDCFGPWVGECSLLFLLCSMLDFAAALCGKQMVGFLCSQRHGLCLSLPIMLNCRLILYGQVIYLNVIVKFMHLIINDAWLHMATCFSSTPTLRILEADCKTFLFFLFNDLPLIRRVMFIQGNIYQNFYACTFF